MLPELLETGIFAFSSPPQFVSEVTDSKGKERDVGGIFSVV